MIQGMGGLMSITGERDDLPGGGPQKVGVAVADLFTGLFASNAIMAALFHRERTGHGQHIDLALLDCQVAMLANMNTSFLASGQPPARLGNAHQSIVPYQVFRGSDGFFIVAVGNDTQYARFCEAIGAPQLATDPRYATNPARVKNRDVLVGEIARRLAGRSATGGRAPRGRRRSLRADPRPRAGLLRRARRGTREVRVAHADAGEVRLVANPMRFSATPVTYDAPPPRLGEHTDEVLGQLAGLSASELAALRARGVV